MAIIIPIGKEAIKNIEATNAEALIKEASNVENLVEDLEVIVIRSASYIAS